MSQRRRRDGARARPAEGRPPLPSVRERGVRTSSESLPAWNWWSAPTAFAFAAGMVVMYFALAVLADAAAFAVYVIALFFFFLFGTHIAVRLFLGRRR
ncbi:MAG TPA: hypothetical protein VNM43_04120 [Dehalococcoidia bacterium]|nr:hypothetical protein [Dehalococcoidia bacterium]